MIKSFKENEVRDSGIIYQSTFEQIKKIYEKDPTMAGELAISAIELVLTGEISSDDYMIDVLLENMKVVNNRSQKKYETKKQNSQQARIQKLKLVEIAELYKQGIYTQEQIGLRVGESQQNISHRLGIIRTEFPELLE